MLIHQCHRELIRIDLDATRASSIHDGFHPLQGIALIVISLMIDRQLSNKPLVMSRFNHFQH